MVFSNGQENEQAEDSLEKGGCDFSSLASVDSFDMIVDHEDNNELHSSDVSMSSVMSYSPFPCDPYESYDWEC